MPPAHGTAALALDFALLCGFWHLRSPLGIPLSLPALPSLGGVSDLISAAFWACSVGCCDPSRIFFPAWKKKFRELAAVRARKVWDARLGIWVSLMLCQVGWMLSLQDGPRPPPRLRSGSGTRWWCRGRAWGEPGSAGLLGPSQPYRTRNSRGRSQL